MNKDKESQSLSLLFFGVTLGTVISSLFHTSRGKQFVHDAKLLVDDLASMLEHTLDDKVSFENSLEGVRVFGDHVLDKLDRVGGFGPKQLQKPSPENKLPYDNSNMEVRKAVAESPQSAFLYHKPIENSEKGPSRPVDDEMAVLQKVARSMFR